MRCLNKATQKSQMVVLSWDHNNCKRNKSGHDYSAICVQWHSDHWIEKKKKTGCPKNHRGWPCAFSDTTPPGDPGDVHTELFEGIFHQSFQLSMRTSPRWFDEILDLNRRTEKVLFQKICFRDTKMDFLLTNRFSNIHAIRNIDLIGSDTFYALSDIDCYLWDWFL